MRRIPALVILLCLLLTTSAWGHSLSVAAIVSLKTPDQLIVKLVDIYSKPMPGGAISVRLTAPDGSAAGSMRLTEGPPGTYTGTIRPGRSQNVDATIEAKVGEDLFRLSSPLDTGRDSPEVTRPMQPVDVQNGFSWNIILFLHHAPAGVGHSFRSLCLYSPD